MPVYLLDLASKLATQEEGNISSASGENTFLLVRERKQAKLAISNFLMLTRDDEPKSTVLFSTVSLELR
jgi:hypothetical protein